VKSDLVSNPQAAWWTGIASRGVSLPVWLRLRCCLGRALVHLHSCSYKPTESRAVSGRCTLCEGISIDDIISTGITLSLEPHWLAWRDLTDSGISRGPCALGTKSIWYGLRTHMDTLIFRYNRHHKLLVVAAVTREFLEGDIHVELFCGEFATAWTYTPSLNIVAAYLSLKCGVAI
jgi:hypothetical protein